MHTLQVYRTSKLALSTHHLGLRVVEQAYVSIYINKVLSHLPVSISHQHGVSKYKKFPNERSFPERSKKYICCGVFFSRMLTRFSFIHTVAQKTKALPAAASLFHPFWLWFQKGTADSSILEGSQKESIPSLSCRSWFLSQFSHPLATQNSSAGARRAVWISGLQFQKHHIGLWMEIQSTSAKLRSKITWI